MYPNPWPDRVSLHRTRVQCTTASPPTVRQLLNGWAVSSESCQFINTHQALTTCWHTWLLTYRKEDVSVHYGWGTCGLNLWKTCKRPRSQGRVVTFHWFKLRHNWELIRCVFQQFLNVLGCNTIYCCLACLGNHSLSSQFHKIVTK